MFSAVFLSHFVSSNIFVSTIYWYLFNDVVPKEVMSRFQGVLRVATYLGLMAYNGFVFPHSIDHFRLVFVTGGIALVVGFGLMCIFVKEGDYPPPPPLALQTKRWADILACLWHDGVAKMGKVRDRFPAPQGHNGVSGHSGGLSRWERLPWECPCCS